MRAVMVMFDSLNRRFLPNYGCDWVQAPNFQRLRERTATFDNFYVGSLPCMPARRDLQTGRYSFLHRSWGPMEPFDNSMPRTLKEHGVFTRLISDHTHYWEDGGATFHTMYSSWDCVRGQEADAWSSRSDGPEIPAHVPTMREFTHPEWWRDNWCNRERRDREGRWPQNMVFDSGLDFLRENRDRDDWFLQIETFDPHEPFDVPEEFAQMYEDGYDGLHFDWPPYAPVTETPAQVAHMRNRYASLLTMCDRNLGRVLDFMDENDMWKDTLLIVNTDHGFLLGEKDWWAKAVMPCYNELANTPFFLWDPRVGVKDVRRKALCQTIDIPATLLEFFDAPIAPEIMGKPMRGVLENDAPIRDYAIFGFHGSFVNITDGKRLYMRASASVGNTPLNEYTLMPTHQQGMFSPKELAHIELCEPFDFSKETKLLKIPVQSRLANATFCNSFQYGSLLFDLENDPEQQHPIDDPQTEAVMINAMIGKMKENGAPNEQYERLGLDPECTYDAQKVVTDRLKRATFESFPITREYGWDEEAKRIFVGMLSLMGDNRVEEYFQKLKQVMQESGSKTVTRRHFEQLAHHFYADDDGKVFYFLNKLARIG